MALIASAPKAARCISRLGLLIAMTIMAACGPTEVLVQGQYPKPIVEKIPVRLGVFYHEDFSGHEFFDNAQSREESEWIVSTGAAQVTFWDQFLAGMFQQFVQLQQVPGPDSANPDVDAVLIPHVEELQYALPAHTSIKVYEIWMRYRFELVTPAGEPIAQWTMGAYGKTPTRLLTSKAEAVNLAAVVALRDAGAHFATGFENVPEVKQWLEQYEVAEQ